ncbi:hypothetical protein GA0070609_3320 [Micromonospora echinaurantiaca]|uniref:DUF4367 domain-containing protein n=1 Tax=Micromonospora echinaurantiaca TaxID=47857 RepID=A0A1C5IHF0_9ACTN|nr:hypothetical protein [Micromonospora echinaurantiaca]SCG57489.1 hypothetical protein GA0070609_3320 [Micromonospora echinaurantiaca]
MDEIKLLETHGPNGPGLSEEALSAARTSLLTEVSAASTAAPYLLARLRSARLRRGQILARVAIGGAGLAVVAAGAVVVVPTVWQSPARPPVTADGVNGTGPGSQGGIKLVAVTAPEFPYALPRLGKASFTADPSGSIMAVYPGANGSDVVLTTGAARADQQIRGQRDISIDGRPGRIVSIPDASGAVASVQVTWQREPGRWVTIVGNGRHASEKAVLQLAGQVVDRPQPIGFKVTIGLVPDGWELGGFKDDGSMISYHAPAAQGLDLHVQWTPKPDTSPDSDVEGFQTAQTVTINERPAKLVAAVQFWRLTAILPDGSGFTLMTPRSFSADQVIAIARSVQLNPSR